MSTTYTIAPLNWVCARVTGHEDGEWWTASTVFGDIQVAHDPECSWRQFRWQYCVDEYYDEATHECDSIADGKAKAEEWYRSRLLPALTPLEPARS